MNLIPRFYDCTAGEVFVDGVNVKDCKLDELRKKVGIVLQKSELFSGTVEDNIKWGDKNATHEEVISAAQAAQADEFIQKIPAGYEGIIAEKGASLSGGQKQRLSISRAVLKKPEILILDDSTSALDLGHRSKAPRGDRPQNERHYPYHNRTAYPERKIMRQDSRPRPRQALCLRYS